MSQSQKNPLGTRKDPTLASDHGDPAVVPLRGPDILENTMPPTPLRELLAADGASVYVLTDDSGLLDTVQQAGGDQYPVFLAESWRDLRDAVTEGRCGIALLDLDAVSGALTDRLSELARLSPALVTLVASTRDRADGLLDLLSRRKIHRLLIKPPTVGITRLLLESSVNRHMELRQRPGPRPAAGRARAATPAGRQSWVIAGVLVAGLLAAIALITFMMRPGTEPTEPTAADTLPDTIAPEVAPAVVPAATAPPVVPTPTQAQNANAATAANEVEPIDAALANGPVAADGSPLPVEAAEPEPAGPTAEELEARYAEVEAALVDDDLDTAASLLTDLETVDSGSSRLGFLQAQLERAREAAALATAAAEAAARAAQAEANPSELTSLIGLARARLARGQIDAPAGDSAVDYLLRARVLDAGSPELAPLANEIGLALLAAADRELAAGRPAAAEALFVQAEDLGVSAEAQAALRPRLREAQEAEARADQDALLATAATREAQGLLFEPSPGSALDAVLEVRRLNPDHPGLEDAFTALRGALSERVDAALAAADWTGAEAAIEALARAGASAATLDDLRADLSYGRIQEAYLAEAGPASELSVLEREAPVYPIRALNRGTEGWVDLEFVVDRDGRPRDLVIVAAEPPGEFDAAALDAVGSYVFVPFERDGRVFERRVALRLRFALQ